jgi:hypothetical protein
MPLELDIGREKQRAAYRIGNSRHTGDENVKFTKWQSKRQN